MPLNTVSPRRPLTSYAKVQAWIGALIRNRRFQLNRPRVTALKHLDVGCGPNTNSGLINLDYLWHPGVDVCWDIRRGLPFASASLQGVFSEHCLEHFSLSPALALLREIRRVLAPGGSVRLVVPDGELYLRTYVRQLAGDQTDPFPYQETEQQDPLWTPMLSVNRIFYQDRESTFGHRLIYDFALLSCMVGQCGFTDIRRRAFREGRDPHLLVDAESRRCESLYVEAMVPSA
jgi:predicted SAM-dependent methyltransferase